MYLVIGDTQWWLAGYLHCGYILVFWHAYQLILTQKQTPNKMTKTNQDGWRQNNRKGGKVEIWIFFLQCNGLDQESATIENTSWILSDTVLNPCVYPLSLSMFSWSLSKCFPDRNVSTFYPSPNWWHMWTLPRRNLVAQSISGTSRFIDWEIPRRTMADSAAQMWNPRPRSRAITSCQLDLRPINQNCTPTSLMVSCKSFREHFRL